LPQVSYRTITNAEWETARPHVIANLDELGFPVFVKPASLGSSIGITKAQTATELDAALDIAFSHDSMAVVEAFADGIEVECAVLDRAGQLVASHPGEITYDADWYDYTTKYTPGAMELIVPARLPESVRDQIKMLALDTFRTLHCSGMARVDFFVIGNEVFVNELNTIPGFTATSVYGKLFEASGIAYAELLDQLVQTAYQRHIQQHRYRH
jgi:D-alanine-D-alanine ligase